MKSSTRIYLLFLLVVLSGWVVAISIADFWSMFGETWPITLVMILGSFVAGATAEGGGAVAFPVFTKVFGISAQDAKIFAFMIQSVGMTTAGLFIYLKRIPVLWPVIGLVLLPGITGLIAGHTFVHLPAPLPKLFFTFVSSVFGIFLIVQRWGLNDHPVLQINLSIPVTSITLVLAGFIGGMVSSIIGVGIDITLFIFLTLMFGVHEKLSTPTTVILMGLLSVAGFVLYASQPGAITPQLWKYWLSAVPVVVIGAPLGAWVCSKIKRDQLLFFLLTLIAVELISTLWLIPLTQSSLVFIAICCAVSVVLFSWMILFRRKNNRTHSSANDHSSADHTSADQSSANI